MLKLPPPVWALVYVLFAVAISWPLGWPKMPGFPLPALGIALVTVPWILPVWAIIMFRREGTEVSPTSPANRKLVTIGPYRFTRNPMYLGLLLELLGWAAFLANPLALLLVPAFVLYINRFQIKPEERSLSALFGGEYGAYRERVRRWL